jgi:hypothetical protein
MPVAVLLALCLMTLPSATAAAPGAAPLNTPADLREDLAIARAALEEGHPGLYRFTPKPELDRAWDAAGKQLAVPMDAWQFYRILAPVITEIHCGHTRIELPDTLNQELNGTRLLLPLQMRVLDGHVWVVRDLATSDARLEGDELTRVNGRSAAELLAAIERAIPCDGFSATLPPQTLRGFRFAGMLERVLGFDGEYKVEVRHASGNREQLTLAGGTVPDLSARLTQRHPEDNAPHPNGEFELLDGGAIARLRLNHFGGTAEDSANTELRPWFQHAFDTLHEQGTKVLILDLRDNGGGEDALGRILFSYLVDQPFPYYNDLVLNGRTFAFQRYSPRVDTIPESFVEKRADGKYHAVGHPNWGTQSPTAPHFAGKLYVLENGASFSTTCEFMSHVRDARRATFVGEESGGAYVGNTSGGVVRVVLPHTHVQVGVPIMRYDLAVAPAQPFGRGILPDVPVAHTIQDVLSGADPELARALALARAEITRH